MPIVTNAKRAENGYYYPQNRLKTPPGEQKTENFFVPYRVVLKRDRTTDVAEP